MISYDDLSEVLSKKARQIANNVLDQNERNVSEAAGIISISRHTVRRAMDGP